MLQRLVIGISKVGSIAELQECVGEIDTEVSAGWRGAATLGS